MLVLVKHWNLSRDTHGTQQIINISTIHIVCRVLFVSHELRIIRTRDRRQMKETINE